MESIRHVGEGCFPVFFGGGLFRELIKLGQRWARAHPGRINSLATLSGSRMKQAFLKQKNPKNILIYAQSGILAGDLAALLSGQNKVDRQTSLPGVLNSLNSKTDVLLLVGAKFQQKQAPDPSATLAKAEACNCKVIVLGDWPGDWQKQLEKNRKSSVTVLSEIPSPAALFDIIGATTHS